MVREWLIDPGEALAIGPMGQPFSAFTQTVSSLNLKMITPINGPCLIARVYMDSRSTSNKKSEKTHL